MLSAGAHLGRTWLALISKISFCRTFVLQLLLSNVSTVALSYFPPCRFARTRTLGVHRLALQKRQICRVLPQQNPLRQRPFRNCCHPYSEVGQQRCRMDCIP